MRNTAISLALIVMMLAVGCPTGEAAPGDVAVVVSKENATDELSFRELVKIFRQERQHWRGSERIYLVMRETGGAEKQLMLERVYKMDEQALKKFWLGKLYRGEIGSFPQTLGSNEAVKRFVSQVPNAISVIDASAADDTVKILRVDGKAPGETGYPLNERW